MTFSVIIPTLNRSKVLKETLESICLQNPLPNEVLVIDQSVGEDTKKVCEKFPITRFFRQNEKSSSRARNVGIENAQTDILFFLDDDVELDPGYFESLLKMFSDPSVSAVQGWVRNSAGFGRMSNLIRKVFLFESGGNKMALLPDFIGTHFSQKPSEISRIEWCSGCGFAVRGNIAREENFEPRFFLYSLAEDRDFSFRAGKRGKLLLNPAATMLHKVEPSGRIPPKKKIFMIYVHQMYLIAKNYGWNFPHGVAFWWNVFGRLLFSTLGLCKFSKERWLFFKWNWGAFFFVVRNKAQLKKGDLTTFTSFLFH